MHKSSALYRRAVDFDLCDAHISTEPMSTARHKVGKTYLVDLAEMYARAYDAGLLPGILIGMIYTWMKMLLAILLGNLVYFFILPYVPESFGHEMFQTDAGLMLDFGICVVLYLVVRKIV